MVASAGSTCGAGSGASSTASRDGLEPSGAAAAAIDQQHDKNFHLKCHASKKPIIADNVAGRIHERC
eukprot:1412201-Pyramimonas_sp.AAC.1